MYIRKEGIFMADPKYPEYNGVLRFDDDNVVEVGLQPDTENITVKLNGTEISGGGGAGLPEVDSSDNGDVLTVVEGEWTNAAPASQLPAVSSSDNGNVLTVVEGAWAKAAPVTPYLIVHSVNSTLDKTWNEINTTLLAGIPAYLLDQYDDLDQGIVGHTELLSLSTYHQTPGDLPESYVVAAFGYSSITFDAATPNDYPSMS